eukprot:TRINITY_DN8081_c0_g1_i1.p1 TRINITY_DN8081_c0_g1~~TRINITY_DN8081_c0_g1_i1.p1  ORF type:complete len:132 (+),score=10.83 TRINITY_DN8081_c0_g1_i1:129-524(+)
MNSVYFTSKEAGEGYMVVKFGDTRSESDNTSNYRADVDSISVHGNNNDSSLGKHFQEAVLDSLVERGMAAQIGNTESYLVKTSTYNTLQSNWDKNTSGNYLSKDEINSIANQQINSGYGRAVHGNAKGEPF